VPRWAVCSREGAGGAGQFDGRSDRRSQGWPVARGGQRLFTTIKLCLLINSNRRPLT
jgi:hypothetical protein